eukprot:gene22217-28768_t
MSHNNTTSASTSTAAGAPSLYDGSSSGQASSSSSSSAPVNASHRSTVPFTSMNVISTSAGLTPSFCAHGDEQIIATAGSSVCIYDFRSNCTRALKAIAEWVIPAPPVVQSNYISSNTVEPFTLTYATAQDNFVIAACQSSRASALRRTASETAARIAYSILTSHNPKLSRLLRIRFTGNTLRIAAAMTTKPPEYNVSTPLSHKLFAALLPNHDQLLTAKSNHNNAANSSSASTASGQVNALSGNVLMVNNNYTTTPSNREPCEPDEIRMQQNYFLDRKGLQVTSAVLLPLRKLLLLGTDDGLVRVIS